MRLGLFSELSLPDTVIRDLHRQNPWWSGGSLPVLPPFRRWPYQKLRERLDKPIAPVLVIRGPRQIGKTTLQMQVIRDLLDTGIAPARILRVQFDELPSFRSVAHEEPFLRISMASYICGLRMTCRKLCPNSSNACVMRASPLPRMQ